MFATLCVTTQISTYKITPNLYTEQEREEIVINNIPNLAFFYTTFATNLVILRQVYGHYLDNNGFFRASDRRFSHRRTADCSELVVGA